jgi:hypothetical protein
MGLPGNELGEGLLPCTVIVKSDGLLLPAPSLTTFSVTTNVPRTGLTDGKADEAILFWVAFI